MRQLISLILAGGWIAALSGCGPRVNSNAAHTSEAWNQVNDPALIGVREQNLRALPTSGQVSADKMPWRGYWWPTSHGGISSRWRFEGQGASYKNFLYPLLSPTAAAQLSVAQLAGLSPSEKYDLYTGRTDFPLTTALRNATLHDVVNDQIPTWHGICHGWAAAATSEEAPGPQATVRLPDGRNLIFYAVDLQALMSQAYSDFSRFQYRMVGARCDEAHLARDQFGRPQNDSCRDVNPATFHLALAAFIGQQHKPFIADMSRDEPVWNYPVVGYSEQFSNYRQISTADALFQVRAPGTVRLIDVETTVQALAGASPSAVPAVTQTIPMKFRYSLELDSQDRIIGGEWLTDAHPDFMWQVLGPPSDLRKTAPLYSYVKGLVELSRRNVPAPAQTLPGTNGIPADGSLAAYAVLRLCNTVTWRYLLDFAHISQQSAWRIGWYRVGPDDVPATADDKNFTRMADLIPLVQHRELQQLVDFAMRNGWANQ